MYVDALMFTNNYISFVAQVFNSDANVGFSMKEQGGKQLF
jgi:hypothetical protein